MNNQQSGPKPGWQTTEFYTMLLGNLISFLLLTGKITPDQAQALNGQAQLIGGILLAVVSTGSYILTRFGLKLPWAQALAGQVNAPIAPETPAPDKATTQPTPTVVTAPGTFATATVQTPPAPASAI